MERMTSEGISVVEIMTPRIAASRGFAPAEYVEVTLIPEDWDGLGGCFAMAVIEQRLKPKGVIQGDPEAIHNGNLVIRIQREDGPRVSIIDHLVYRLQRARQLLRR